MSSANGSSQTKPAIRSFQYDSSSMGSLASSVNLFRGDLNLPQTLFSLPGRTKNSGLDLSLSLMYESNVHREAGTWNTDAPTGVVGLGWSLPLTWIEAQSNGSPVSQTRRYTFYDNGSANSLVQQPQQPFVLALDSSLIPLLANGTANAQIINQFREHGLPLSDSATLQNQASEQWLLDDVTLQQQFILQLEDSDTLQAYWGGAAYQLQNFSFKQIIYFEQYERWLVIDDSGLRHAFGGLSTTTTEGYQTSVNNSIVWDVWWQGEQGEALWQGASNVTQGQKQIAGSWYLNSVTDRFGDNIQYCYNEFSRSNEGFIEQAEQQVGEGGLPYTKAIYLTSINDVFGRKVSLSYAEKLWNEDDEAPREYTDPHNSQPNNSAGPYQDRYETKYLDSIRVADTEDQTLLSISCIYEPSPGSDYPAVAEVAGFSGRLKGDTYKRFLSSVVISNGSGEALPGMAFDYFLNDTDAGAQRGAIAAVTYPQGGRAQLTYGKQELAICDRTETVSVPAGMPTGATPRVFYGSDYVVSLWYHSGQNLLSLQVFTWQGRWISWQLDDNDAVIDSNGINLESLGVIADEDFFAIYFNQSSHYSKAYVFQKNIGIPGRWLAADINTPTAKNTPSVQYDLSNGDVNYLGGSNFFVANQFNTSSSTGSYNRVSWNWSSQQWSQHTTSFNELTWVAAQSEYIVSINNSGTLVLDYVDGRQNWQQTSQTIAALNATGSGNVSLVTGSAMVVVSHLTALTSTAQQYDIEILQWDKNYQFQSQPFKQSFTDYFGTNNSALSWQPQIISDTLVAINGNLLRYNGQQWLVNTSLYSQQPYPNTTQRFSYGADCAVWISASTNNSAYPSMQALSFDPTTASDSWSTQPTVPTALLSQTADLSANWPWLGNDEYAVLGPNIYYRGSQTDWQTVFAGEPLQSISGFIPDGQNFDSESLMNQAPGFITYATSSGAVEKQAQTLILQNGNIQDGAPQSFDNEFIYTSSIDSSTGSGVSPQGSQMFVSYNATASNFDSANTLYLHYYAGYAVEGNIEDYPVVKMQFFDGYGGIAANSSDKPTSSICYKPDTQTAACDASGQTVQYFQSTVLPGTDDPTKTPYGYKLIQYLNGLGDTSGDNVYDMLNGMQLQSQSYDAEGKLLSSQTNQWQVFTEIASDPVLANADTIRLRGGWVTQTSQTSIDNGVSSAQTSDYIPEGLSAPYTGQVASTSTTSWNDEGQQETMVTSSCYGVEVNSVLRALNILTAKGGQTSTIQTAGSNAITVKATAASYAVWPSNAGNGVYSPAREADFQLLDNNFSQFPYEAYKPGDTPEGWQLQGRITARTALGQISERCDACGVYSANLYSQNLDFAIAKLPNAAQGQFAYLGFESYEDNTLWNPVNVSSCNNTVLTGLTAGVLPGDANASLSTRITPANHSQSYVLSLWYQTDEGFTANSQTGCSLTVTTDNNAATPVFTGFEDTHGEWRQLSVGLPLDVANSSISIQLAISNTSHNDVRIDSVFLVPLVGGILAKSYSPQLHQVLCLQDTGGRIRRSLYDRFAQPVIQTSLNGAPNQLSLNYQSRQTSVNGQFNPLSPNVCLSLNPAEKSTVERFYDGDNWQQRWLPDNTADWTVDAGTLQFNGTATNSLNWCGKGLNNTNSAVYFEVQAQTDNPSLSISVGGVAIHYSNGVYTSTGAGECLFSTSTLAMHCLLVRSHNTVLFFGDGQLLFSATASFNDSNFIISPANAMDFRHIATLGAPRIGIAYQDGAGRQRQVQQLNHDDSLIGQVVYDEINRQLAITRTVPGLFGDGASLPLMQYRSDFIDQATFLNNIQDSWQMPGAPADYYAGQIESGIARSDDQCYAYNGTRWEASPRSQALEYGQPGLNYAINNIDSTTAEDRLTTQLLRSANNGDSIALPAGNYQQNQIISPVKTQAMQVLDNSSRGMAYAALDQQGSVVAQSGAQRSYALNGSLLQTCVATKYPNAYIDGVVNTDEGFTAKSVLDGLGYVLSSTDNDTGNTAFIYDNCGRIRFTQPEMEAGEQWFIYYKYDRSGRLIETGSIPQAWDQSSLQAYANDASWPDSVVNPKLYLSCSYDGNGDEPDLIGRKVQTITYNDSPDGLDSSQAVISTEQLSYNRAGQVILYDMRLSGASSVSGVIAYTYNNIGELTVLTMPQGAPIKAVHYSYNDLGQITTIAEGTDPNNVLASYTYTADGSVQTEALANNSWLRQVQYTSTGWAKQVLTSSQNNQSLQLSYDYFADGAAKECTIDFNMSSNTSTTTDSYSYDAQGRLYSATGGAGINSYHYDNNGNMTSVDYSDGHSDLFTLTSNTGNNQLQQVTYQQSQSDVGYDALGRVNQLQGGTLSYQSISGLTAAWTFGDTQTQLAYGEHRQRIFKRVQDDSGYNSDTLYFCGPGLSPVARIDDGVWTSYIQGPTGLLASIREGDAQFGLKDNVGSVLAMVKEDGSVANTQNYLPFGCVSCATNTLPDYLFQGREWDSEANLYNFGDRMYSPQLRRFLSPDPQRQFPSPYVFVGNKPLQVTDPTGDMSTAGQVGVGVAMGALAVGGIALMVVSAGTATPAVAAAETAAVATEATVETTAVVAATADVTTTAAEGAAAVADTAVVGESAASATEAVAASATASEASAEVSTGAAASAAVTSDVAADAEVSGDASMASKALKMGGRVLGSGINSAGTSGLQYDMQNGQDFSVQGLFESMGIGFVSGLASGAAGELLSPLGGKAKKAFDSEGKRFGSKSNVVGDVFMGGVKGVVGSDVSTMLTNIQQQQPVYQGLLKQSVTGFSSGAWTTALSTGAQNLVDTTNPSTLMVRLQQMATSSSTYSMAASAGNYLGTQFVASGQDQAWGEDN